MADIAASVLARLKNKSNQSYRQSMQLASMNNGLQQQIHGVKEVSAMAKIVVLP